MKRLLRYFPCLFLTLSLDGRLAASPLFTTGNVGGETDTLSIALNPSSGSIGGPAGSTIGWGFTVTWTATQNDISFTGSSLGSLSSPETNNSFLAGYTDFIGANSGPNGIALGPGSWSQSFNAATMAGVGSYQITRDQSLAFLGAQDTGQITFDFDIYNGDPSSGNATDLGSFSYYGNSTSFAVTITPEPGTVWLLLAIMAAVGISRVRLSGLVSRLESYYSSKL